MINSIRLLVEDYFSSTEQYNQLMKSQAKAEKKSSKEYESRQNKLKSILGLITYNKYSNKGTFAPIPVKALNLSFDDFYYLNPNNKKSDYDINQEKTIKLVNELKKVYYRNDFKLFDTGSKLKLETNLVFKTIDDMIDFFINIEKCYKKVYHENKEISKNDKIVKAFRNYIK